jgi:hypothetical protein
MNAAAVANRPAEPPAHDRPPGATGQSARVIQPSSLNPTTGRPNRPELNHSRTKLPANHRCAMIVCPRRNREPARANSAPASESASTNNRRKPNRPELNPMANNRANHWRAMSPAARPNRLSTLPLPSLLLNFNNRPVRIVRA